MTDDWIGYDWSYGSSIYMRVFYVLEKGWRFRVICDEGTSDEQEIVPDDDDLYYVTWQAARNYAHLQFRSIMGKTLTGNGGVGKL